jgi:hypothetical protein
MQCSPGGAPSLFVMRSSPLKYTPSTKIKPLGLGLLFSPPTLSLRYSVVEDEGGLEVTKHFQVTVDHAALVKIKSHEAMDECAQALQKKYKPFLGNVALSQIRKFLVKLRDFKSKEFTLKFQDVISNVKPVRKAVCLVSCNLKSTAKMGADERRFVHLLNAKERECVLVNVDTGRKGKAWKDHISSYYLKLEEAQASLPLLYVCGKYFPYDEVQEYEDDGMMDRFFEDHDKEAHEEPTDKPAFLAETEGLQNKHHAAYVVQGMFRTCQAREECKERIREIYEKTLDQNYNRHYYFNNLTGESSWTKPKLLGNDDLQEFTT